MRIRGRNRAPPWSIPDQSPSNHQAQRGSATASKLSNGTAEELHQLGDLPRRSYYSQGSGFQAKFDSGETMSGDHSHDWDNSKFNNHSKRPGAEESHRDDEEEKNSSNSNYNGGTKTKKRKNTSAAEAAVVVEGSRCSRVNGRGWRCCQPTLIGYSLCEHHLGKGRMRSVSSVRGQLGTSKPVTIINHNIHTSQSNEIDFQQEEKRVQVPQRKRNKIGMVKARSISSLLDATSHPPAAMESENVGDEPLHEQV